MILIMIFMYEKKGPETIIFRFISFFIVPIKSLNIIKMVISPCFFAVSPPKIYTPRKKIVNCANFKM